MRSKIKKTKIGFFGRKKEKKKELAYHELTQAMPVGQQMTITSAWYCKCKIILVVLNN